MKNLSPKLPKPVSAIQLKQRATVPTKLFLLIIMLLAFLVPFELLAQAPTISYSSPQTYTTGTAIATLTPASTGVAAQAYSGSPVSIGSGFNNPVGVALDAQGNVYVADQGNNAVKMIPAGGGAPITLSLAISAPIGVAVDFAGNVYVGNENSSSYWKIPAGGGPIIVNAAIYPVGSIAVNALGDVYMPDGLDGGIYVYPADGSAPSAITSNAFPLGVAVGHDFNYYVINQVNGADPPPYNNGVTAYLAVNNYQGISIGTGLGPSGIAVDAIGNVFVTQGSVYELPVGGGTQFTIGSGFNNPQGLAVDGAGNVYVGDSGNNTVKEIKPIGGYYISPSLPAGLSFDQSTGIISGTPTEVSPATNYTVTAYNAAGSGTTTVNIKTTGNNANLTNLVLSSGTLAPAFATATKNYTASVSNATTSLTITPTASNPLATISVNGVAVVSGVASTGIPLAVGPNTITTVVTAQGGVTTNTYTVVVTRTTSTNALLASISLSPVSTLVATTGAGYLNFKTTVANSETSVQVTPTAKDPSATITVNGLAVASGTASQSIPLPVGQTTITTVITAQNGVTTKTIIITVTRPPSTNALLASISLSPVSTLIGTTGTGYLNFKTTAPNSESSLQVAPTAKDPLATITVNGLAVASGTASQSIPLPVGQTTITTVITAQDGVTTKTIIITVTRPPATNALLASISLSPVSTLVGTTGAGYLNFKSAVLNSESSVQVKATAKDATANITVNGNAVTSGSLSQAIALNVGANTITTVITAQDGITTKTITITVTRAAGPIANPDQATSVEQTTADIGIENDGVLVHQGLSPNGDGINDFLVIDGIISYPENKLTIINRNGALVYEAQGYDNTSKVFDGHSSNTGIMQVPGTYFYALDYSVNGVAKHKTGFIVLKY